MATVQDAQRSLLPASGSPVRRNTSVLVPEFRFSAELEEDPEDHDEDDQDGVLGPDSEAAECEMALLKDTSARTREDCEILQRATAKVKFIRAMDDPGQHLELCRALKLAKFPNGTIVFNQGDEGSMFYIIYSGAVDVFINDFKQGKEGIGTCVVSLGVGDAFGELALLGNGMRKATIKVRSAALPLPSHARLCVLRLAVGWSSAGRHLPSVCFAPPPRRRCRRSCSRSTSLRTTPRARSTTWRRSRGAWPSSAASSCSRTSTTCSSRRWPRS